MKFECATSASQGQRPYQEDTAAVWPDPATNSEPARAPAESVALLAVLADGMGGHAGGALASQTVCREFIRAFAGERSAVRDRLKASMEAANREVERTADADPRLSGMGSTLIGVAFSADSLEWVSVGDSPLFLYRRAEIALLNEDHSLAPLLDQLAKDGKMTVEQARNDSRRHMLRSAISGQEIELYDLCRKALKLEPGDYIVLASDGIQTIEPGEIARVIERWADDGATAVADALIREVDGARDLYQDNVTVVVVRPLAEDLVAEPAPEEAAAPDAPAAGPDDSAAGPVDRGAADVPG